jgi:hypothetical protein
MPEPHDAPDGLEAMALQLVLHKLTTLEHAMQGIPPLLKKIIDHLEAQTQRPEVEIATYAQLYPELQDAADVAPEPEAEEAAAPVLPAYETRQRWWHWFVREG